MYYGLHYNKLQWSGQYFTTEVCTPVHKTVKTDMLFSVLFYSLCSRNYENEWNNMSFGPQHFRGGLVMCFWKIHNMKAFLETTHLPLHARSAMLKALKRMTIISHLIIFMEQNPSWETYSYFSDQEILRILWNPKVHNGVYKSLRVVPVLSQLNPFHLLQAYSLRPILLLTSHLRLHVPSGLLPAGSVRQCTCLATWRTASFQSEPGLNYAWDSMGMEK